MKFFKYILPAVVLGAAMTSCDSCDLDPVLPPVVPPTAAADIQPTMSILDFKQEYWSSDSRCVNPIGLTADGDSIILRGRVVSTDVTGNFFKQIALRDETASIILKVNLNDVYKSYPYGVDVCVNVTGLYAGNYNNLMQIGDYDPGYNYPYNIPEDSIKTRALTFGWAEPDNAEPLEVDLEALKDLKRTPEGLQEWQCQLVTINNLSFNEPGSEFSPEYTNTANVYAKDEHGNSICLRFSGRSSFAHRIIPGGRGSITGILTYYNSDWQLIPCTIDDLKDFTPVEAPKDLTFRRATSVANGDYAIWFEGNVVARPYASGTTYGWLQVASCTPDANGEISTTSTNLFTFTKYEDGWTINDSNGNFLYMQGTYNSFQLTQTPDMSSKFVYWTVTFEEDGSATISNVGNGKTMRYSTPNGSGGAYPSLSSGTASYLYQPVK